MSVSAQTVHRARLLQALVRVGLVALVMAAVVASLLLASWRSGGLKRTVQSPVLAATLAEGRRAPADEAQVATQIVGELARTSPRGRVAAAPGGG